MRVMLREIAQTARHDPKKALLDSVGDVSGIDVFHNLVLVATYIEPETTPGGIIKPDRAIEESRFQGKAALVLSVGPLAFKDDGSAQFGGKSVQTGDWVMVRPSDGFELFKIKTGKTGSDATSCRLFEDIHIKARLSDPALIY